MGELRTVDTEYGRISYTLIVKRVKNLNLRICDRDEVVLSVPEHCSPEVADTFVRQKSGWITAHRKRHEERERMLLLPELNRAECTRLLHRSLVRMWPLVAVKGVPMPQLKVRKMRSQWGNCHWSQGYITLNEALHRCPEHLRDYVALHELVHFLHHDHGPGFYAEMDGLMPDWRVRRAELKKYGAAIRN